MNPFLAHKSVLKMKKTPKSQKTHLSHFLAFFMVFDDFTTVV